MLGVDGTDVLGSELAQAAAGDHGGSAHADVGVLGGDDHVAAAEQCGVSGEASARGDAYQRNGAGQASEQIKRHRVETRHHGGVGIAGPSPATLGEQHHRQPLALGQLEEPVLFPVVLVALRAGEHRVVVRHHHHACPLRPNPVDADRCDAADQAVRRGVGDQVVLAAASTLGGNHQRAVLDERPVVDEVLDVFPGGSPTPAVNLPHRVGPPRIQPGAVPRQHPIEVVPDEGEVHVRRRHLRFVDRSDEPKLHHVGAGGDLGAHIDRHRHHHGGGRSHQVVVHLHRLDDRKHHALCHPVAGSDPHLQHPALDRRGDHRTVDASAGIAPGPGVGIGIGVGLTHHPSLSRSDGRRDSSTVPNTEPHS